MYLTLFIFGFLFWYQNALEYSSFNGVFVFLQNIILKNAAKKEQFGDLISCFYVFLLSILDIAFMQIESTNGPYNST